MKLACFAVVPDLTEGVEVLRCCSERALWRTGWNARGALAFCNWLEKQGITRKDFRPSCPYPDLEGSQWVAQLIRSLLWDRSPLLPGSGSPGSHLTLTTLLKSIPKREGDSGRGGPNPNGWQAGSWNCRAPINAEPRSQAFWEQGRPEWGDTGVEVRTGAIVPHSILAEIPQLTSHTLYELAVCLLGHLFQRKFYSFQRGYASGTDHKLIVRGSGRLESTHNLGSD